MLITRQEEFFGRAGLFLYSAYVRFQEEVIFSNDTPTWKLKKKAFHTSLKMWVQISFSLQWSQVGPSRAATVLENAGILYTFAS